MFSVIQFWEPKLYKCIPSVIADSTVVHCTGNVHNCCAFIQAAAYAGLSESLIASLVPSCEDGAVKNRLKVYTEEALNHGVSNPV